MNNVTHYSFSWFLVSNTYFVLYYGTQLDLWWIKADSLSALITWCVTIITAGFYLCFLESVDKNEVHKMYS